MVVTSTIPLIAPVSLPSILTLLVISSIYMYFLRRERKITQQLLIAPLFLPSSPYSYSLLFHLHVIFAKNPNITQTLLIMHAHPNDGLHNYPLPTRIVHIGKYHRGHQQPTLGAL